MTTTTLPYTKQGNAESHARAEFGRVVGGEYKTTASVNWAIGVMDRHLAEAGKTRADLTEGNKRKADRKIAVAVQTSSIAGAKSAFTELANGKCKSPVTARMTLVELRDSLVSAKKGLGVLRVPGQKPRQVARQLRAALVQVPEIETDLFCYRFLMGYSRLY